MECEILKPKEKVFIAEISDVGKIVWRQNLHSTQFETIPTGDFSIAMTGNTFAWIADKKPSLLPYLIIKGAVFARMSPDQKAELGKVKKIGNNFRDQNYSDIFSFNSIQILKNLFFFIRKSRYV